MTKKRVIALGFFDGVHLGHGALLKRTVELSGKLHAIPAACTLDVHPAGLVSGERVALLTTTAQRQALMEALYGIREVIIAPFAQVRTMPWDRYVTDYLIRDHQACHLVAGANHRFGYQGQGTADKLRDLCARLGVGCDIIPPVEVDGQVVSSTAIRAALAAGDLGRALAMLGHPLTPPTA